MTTPNIPIKSIAAVLNYLEHDERRDWENQGQPDQDHIYPHVTRVRGWLDQHDGGVHFAAEAEAPADEATTRQALEAMQGLFFAAGDGEGLPQDLISFVHHAVTMKSLPMLRAAQAAVATYRNNLDEIPI